MKKTTQSGITLLELTVVLLILIALAGLVVPYMGGTSNKALCDATDLSMQNIKKAIMDGYYLDTLGKFPQDLNVLTSNPAGAKYNLHYLFSDQNLDSSRIHKPFDPDSTTGWRAGGYLQSSTVLDADLTGNSANTTYVNDPLKQNHRVVLDAWGRPIILQVNGSVARLVSAGPGSGLGVDNGDIDTPILDDAGTPAIVENSRQIDDRILYLNAPTPAADINPSCGQ